MKKIILVIEDKVEYHADVKAAAQELKLGWRFIFTTNFEDAMAVLKKERIDGIVSDVFFPEKKGGPADSWENAQKIREYAIENNLPFIFCTNNAFHDNNGNDISGFAKIIYESPTTRMEIADSKAFIFKAKTTQEIVHLLSLFYTAYDELVYSNMNAMWNKYRKKVNYEKPSCDENFAYELFENRIFRELFPYIPRGGSRRARSVMEKLWRCACTYGQPQSESEMIVRNISAFKILRKFFKKSQPDKNWWLALKILRFKMS